MPFDQTNWKQDTEAKPDVFSLEGLIAWLERQPQETSYDFSEASTCLLTRWHSEFGSGLEESGLSYTSGICVLSGWASEVAAISPWTYGAALSRARALLAETRK